MGTRVAPPLANIFMGELETKMLETAPFKPFLYLRYIDDNFLIWTGSLSELKCFYRHCNSFHKTIKFTIEYSEKQVSFLDTLVIRTEDGHILFDLFSKPTDKHCYLHYTSNHPDKLKISGPYNQFLRLKRICTKTADFEKHASNLVTFYKRRNYPKQVIMENLQKAHAQDQKSLLKPPPPLTKQRTEYHSYSPKIRASYPSREPYTKYGPSYWSTIKNCFGHLHYWPTR